MTTDTIETRRDEMLRMKTVDRMTLAEIGKRQPVPISASRVGQIIGPSASAVNYRLLEVYRFIQAYHAEHGYAPSIAEMASHFPSRNGADTSTSVITYYLGKMEKLGMVKVSPGIARGVVLIPLNKKRAEIAQLLKMEQEKNDE